MERLIPPHHHPISQRSRAQHPPHMIYEEYDADLFGAEDTGAIVLPVLLPGVKFTITGTIIQLFILEGMLRDVVGDYAN